MDHTIVSKRAGILGDNAQLAFKIFNSSYTFICKERKLKKNRSLFGKTTQEIQAAEHNYQSAEFL